MENILFASAYMRLIFGLEVEYLYFSDFRINIEKKSLEVEVESNALSFFENGISVVDLLVAPVDSLLLY
jgi:hypothetical protein